MKPTKNKVFCKDCERTKMLFETKKKAENFIKFNNTEIEKESGYSPQRTYYCIFCAGWHLTSIKDKIGISKKEQLLEQFLIAKENKQDLSPITKNSKTGIQEKRNIIMHEFESKIKDMDNSQKELFFTHNLNILNKKIEQLLNSDDISDKNKLKELRIKLEILYIVRKKNGFQKPVGINKKLEEARAKRIEEWRLWSEKNENKHNTH